MLHFHLKQFVVCQACSQDSMDKRRTDFKLDEILKLFMGMDC